MSALPEDRPLFPYAVKVTIERQDERGDAPPAAPEPLPRTYMFCASKDDALDLYKRLSHFALENHDDVEGLPGKPAASAPPTYHLPARD